MGIMHLLFWGAMAIDMEISFDICRFWFPRKPVQSSALSDRRLKAWGLAHSMRCWHQSGCTCCSSTAERVQVHLHLLSTAEHADGRVEASSWHHNFPLPNYLSIPGEENLQRGTQRATMTQHFLELQSLRCSQTTAGFFFFRRPRLIIKSIYN